MAEQKPNKNIAQRIVQQSWLRAKTGWKPNKNTAQGDALGRNGIAILRSERAKGMGRVASELPPAALSERKILSSLTPQGGTLGCNPFGASPRHRSQG